jgi:hypothetical protein
MVVRKFRYQWVVMATTGGLLLRSHWQAVSDCSSWPVARDTTRKSAMEREEMRESTVNTFNIKFKYSSKRPSIHSTARKVEVEEMCWWTAILLLLCPRPSMPPPLSFRKKAKRIHACTTSYAETRPSAFAGYADSDRGKTLDMNSRAQWGICNN